MNRYPYASMRGRFDLSAYLVLGPQDTHGRPVEDIVAAALAGGVTFVQLRAKPADAADIVAMARRIAAAIDASGAADRVPLVIDDRVDAAWQCRREGIKVDGVHIGQSDMDPVAARELLGDDAIIGLSADLPAHIDAANALPEGTIDYIGAGPLHLTATKPDCAIVEADGTAGTLDGPRIDALCRVSRFPVVVGGGVHEEDVPMLARSLADGWFVVSAIAGADDPQDAARRLVAAWRDNRAGRSRLIPVLAVSGSDSSGGAGMQADLKTMTANGVFAMSALTAITAQNTMGVTDVENVSPAMIGAQIDAVWADIPPAAVKIGMVSSAAAVGAIADRLEAHGARNIVLDPVMVATSGARLIDDDALGALTGRLFPLASIITPNIPETQVLLDLIARRGRDGDDACAGVDDAPTLDAGRWAQGAALPESITSREAMEAAGRIIAARFGCAVLVKGGHGVADADDLLVADGEATWIRGRRVDNPNTHGTGCTLSSAIAANLAKGDALADAVRHAKAYLTGALDAQLDLGHGSGPMDHAWAWHGTTAH